LNGAGWPSFEAVAIQGTGVFETLKGITRATLVSLHQRLTQGDRPKPKPAAAGTSPGSAAAKPAAAAKAAAAKPASKPAPAPQPEAAAKAAEPPAPPREVTPVPRSKPVRRTVDVDGELARLRREALRNRGGATRTPSKAGAPSPLAAAKASSNGKRELSRDIKLTLKRPDFERARRFTLSFQVEDDDAKVVDAVKGLQVDLGEAGDLGKVLLRLNIALQAKE
jgi:hypothetical protein